MTKASRSRSAVSISWEFIRNAPSPVATSTWRCGRAILVPIAPGTDLAMLDGALPAGRMRRRQGGDAVPGWRGSFQGPHGGGERLQAAAGVGVQPDGNVIV